MPRRLDVIPGLLDAPCPVDPSALPRLEGGGLGCADCGRTVVDTRALTLEEVVDLRRRKRSSPERICAAYTIDREDRVLLRAAPGSSTVIAVAVSVLLAACEGGPGQAPAPPLPPVAAVVASAAVGAQLRGPVPEPLPAPASPPSAGAQVVAVVVPSATAAPPACIPGHGSRSKHGGAAKKAHASGDPEMLAGY